MNLERNRRVSIQYSPPFPTFPLSPKKRLFPIACLQTFSGVTTAAMPTPQDPRPSKWSMVASPGD